MTHRTCDVVVIGGGFFGAYLAVHHARKGRQVILLEARSAIMELASRANQARIHNGYHYPRSILTALRSRENYERFLAEFSPAVAGDFVHHYAIARHGSHITAQQFALFCERIDAEYQQADDATHFNPDMVSQVFRVKEAVFDSEALRSRMVHDLKAAGVDLQLGTRALRIHVGPGDQLTVVTSVGDHIQARRMLNCTYAAMNDVLAASGLPGVPLKIELVEIALLDLPTALRGLGWTIIDGPFSGCLPYPTRKAASLYHTRSSSHGSWNDDATGEPRTEVGSLQWDRRSDHVRMMKDAQRFVPALSASGYIGSEWVLRAKLPGSARTDSRPILFARCVAAPGLFHVMGGKIDNVFDVVPVMEEAFDHP